MSTGVIRVGVSGWVDDKWRGSFYPKDLRRNQELEFAATRFSSLEMTCTLHTLQRPEAFRDWSDQVPTAFVFAVAGPRLITHVLRLRDTRVALANFFASGLLRLGLHMGPILWQLPSNLPFDPARLETFLQLLPRTTTDAIALGRQPEQRLPPPPWLATDTPRPIRHALEVRHRSFRCPMLLELLRAYNVALVCGDQGDGPPLMDVTSDFIYCRALRLSRPDQHRLLPRDVESLGGAASYMGGRRRAGGRRPDRREGAPAQTRRFPVLRQSPENAGASQRTGADTPAACVTGAAR